MTRASDDVIDGLWNRLWAGGVSDPAVALAQISYLMLLREIDKAFPASAASESLSPFAGSEQLRWSSLLGLSDDELPRVLQDELIPFLCRSLPAEAERALRDAHFLIVAPPLIRECIVAIDDLHARLDGSPVSVVYEELLRKFELSGRDGGFSTPRDLVAAMVELADPGPGEIVCDPAVGTAGYLVEARRHVVVHHGEPPRDDCLIGIDVNASMARIALINLMFHGVRKPAIEVANALTDGLGLPEADVVLTNPPFGGKIDPDHVDPHLDLATKRTELLFMELSRRLLRPGGRVATVVPAGVLFGRSRAHVELRRRWLTELSVEAIVTLPATTFRTYANVETAIVLARADGATSRVLFCQVGVGAGAGQPPAGYLQGAVEAVRAKLQGLAPETDAAALLADGMWSASIDDIRAQDWSLSPGLYRPQADDAPDADPLALLDDLDRLEEQLRQELREARTILERLA